MRIDMTRPDSQDSQPPAAPQRMTCPKCLKIDKTDFSKCRHCGTKYDWTPENKNGFSGGNFWKGGGLLVALFVVGYMLRGSLGPVLLMMQGKVNAQSEAIVAETTATLKNDPKNVDALTRRANAEFDMFRADLAEKDLTAAINISPSAALYKRRAMIYQSLTQETEAAADRKMAEQLH
jgi:hypothetical protein